MSASDSIQINSTTFAIFFGVLRPWWPRIDLVMTYQRMKPIATKVDALQHTLVNTTSATIAQIISGFGYLPVWLRRPAIWKGKTKHVKLSTKARLITKMLVTVRSFFVVKTETMIRVLPKRPIIANPARTDATITRWWKAIVGVSTGDYGLASIIGEWILDLWEFCVVKSICPSVIRRFLRFKTSY